MAPVFYLYRMLLWVIKGWYRKESKYIENSWISFVIEKILNNTVDSSSPNPSNEHEIIILPISGWMYRYLTTKFRIQSNVWWIIFILGSILICLLLKMFYSLAEKGTECIYNKSSIVLIRYVFVSNTMWYIKIIVIIWRFLENSIFDV